MKLLQTTNGANKYNLIKIDNESIKNNVLMNNTFYAFKKAGNYLIYLSLEEFGAIFSNFLSSVILMIIFVALFKL